VQRATIGFSSGNRPQMMCGVVVPDDEGHRVSAYLEDCVGERLDELEISAYGIGVVATSRRPYDALVIYDRAWRAPRDAEQ
jgi:hypothetical protein